MSAALGHGRWTAEAEDLDVTGDRPRDPTTITFQLVPCGGILPDGYRAPAYDLDVLIRWGPGPRQRHEVRIGHEDVAVIAEMFTHPRPEDVLGE